LSKFENITKFIFDKVIFPKKIIIDTPGIIINRYVRKYGSNQQRLIFFFEESIIQVQKSLKEKTKKNENIWYELGKQTALRYISLANAKAPSKYLIPFLINYLFTGLRSTGLSAATKITYDSKNKTIKFEGKNNMICRITKDPSFSCGVIAAFASFILNENMKCVSECRCPNNCLLICSQDKSEKLPIPPIIDSNYNRLNFPKINTIKDKKHTSFADLIKFKYIEHSDKFKYCKKIILPCDCGIINNIINVLEKEYKNTIKKALIKSGKIIAEEILPKSEKISQINTVISIFCGLGWGIPNYKIKDNEITFIFKYPPITPHGFNYTAYELNGFLNYIYKKEVKLNKIEFQKMNLSYMITYKTA
jgi:hypothetical protein